MSRQYNFIYSKLVRNEDDFVGHIDNVFHLVLA